MATSSHRFAELVDHLERAIPDGRLGTKAHGKSHGMT